MGLWGWSPVPPLWALCHTWPEIIKMIEAQRSWFSVFQIFHLYHQDKYNSQTKKSFHSLNSFPLVQFIRSVLTCSSHDTVMDRDKQSLIANSKPMIVSIIAGAITSPSQESNTLDCNWGHKSGPIVKFSKYWQGRFFRCLIQLIVRRIEVSLRYWAEVQLLAAPDKDWIKSCRS